MGSLISALRAEVHESLETPSSHVNFRSGICLPRLRLKDDGLCLLLHVGDNKERPALRAYNAAQLQTTDLDHLALDKKKQVPSAVVREKTFKLASARVLATRTKDT